MSTEKPKEFTTKQAVLYLLINNMVQSKYALAKMLNIQPIMINNYLKKTRMSIDTAKVVKNIYNIIITDVYDNRSKLNDTLETPSTDS